MQATAEQLQQAHHDRTLQLPRREFSEAAIEARKQLLDQAYAVLSDPSQRQDYDASFWAKSYDLLEVGRSADGSEDDRFARPTSRVGADLDSPDPYSANIEIADEQFAGALLILQELGEYELVLKLGHPYLQGGSVALKQGHFGDPDIIFADVVLTVALACLELGREQWQQGQYESAAESLQMGQDILLRESLFPTIRGEMQSDLYKLRPYRVLELVALPEEQATARQQGLTLLEEMLEDRNGIDGTGDDQSGLTVDDFLRFIQQLRSYLTAAEQQTLFENEARRPSAVAVYLAVYALLARGFAERQPALIRRSKSMLLRLGTRQDVHLEQAICSLLLGQTEEASRALELSQEFESLAFIREHSQDSPDLLPGLCLYSERWLQNEVFPHFRDLAQRQASLKEYFADEDVQAYLEELPSEPEPANAWSSRSSASYRQPTYNRLPTESRLPSPGSRREEFPVSTATATVDLPEYTAPLNGAGVQAAERVGSSPEDGQSGGRSTRRSTSGQPSAPPPTPPPAGSGATRRPRGRSLRLDRVLLLAAISVGSILLLIFFSRLLTNRPRTVSSADRSQPVQPLTPLLSELVAPQSQGVVADEPLDETNAATILETWLSTKAAAMGSDHKIDQLATILTDPALSAWQARAETLERSDSYWQYEHSDLEVTAVEIDTASSDVEEVNPARSSTRNRNTAATPQTATVEATVIEQGEFYNNGQLDPNSSYESTLQVRYNLVRADGEWRIESWDVLE